MSYRVLYARCNNYCPIADKLLYSICHKQPLGGPLEPDARGMTLLEGSLSPQVLSETLHLIFVQCSDTVLAHSSTI